MTLRPKFISAGRIDCVQIGFVRFHMKGFWLSNVPVSIFIIEMLRVFLEFFGKAF